MNLVREAQQPPARLVRKRSHRMGSTRKITLEKENQLASLIKRGNKVAFVQVYERYLKPVYGYFYRQTCDISTCENLTSETFTWLLYHFHDGIVFKQGCNQYIFGIAYYVLLAWRKKGQLISLQTISVDEFEKEGKGVLDELLAQEQANTVWDLVYQLPPDYQQVLILRYKDDLSYVEIALQMKRTVNACRTLHGRAMRKLGEIVHAEEDSKKERMNGQRTEISR